MTAYFRARRYDPALLTGPVLRKKFPAPRAPSEKEVAP